MPMNDFQSMQAASEIVKAALQGGALKLNGPSGNPENDLSAKNAEKDAVYLSALIKRLDKVLQGQ